jgi:hypothetical protein
MLVTHHGPRRDDALSLYQRGLRTLPSWRDQSANLGATTFTLRPLKGEVDVKSDTLAEVLLAALGIGAGFAIAGAALKAISNARE